MCRSSYSFAFFSPLCNLFIHFAEIAFLRVYLCNVFMLNLRNFHRLIKHPNKRDHKNSTKYISIFTSLNINLMMHTNCHFIILVDFGSTKMETKKKVEREKKEFSSRFIADRKITNDENICVRKGKNKGMSTSSPIWSHFDFWRNVLSSSSYWTSNSSMVFRVFAAENKCMKMQFTIFKWISLHFWLII